MMARVTFSGGGAFWGDLTTKVNSYLAQPGVKKTAYRRLQRKAAIIIAWALGSYAALLLLPHNWWQILVCGTSLVLAAAAAAFNISHDGNHDAFSESRRVNRMAGYVLELLGGSSFTWKVKHNRSHHTYPNVVGYDDDIDAPPLGRFASSQKYHPWYKWQHVYLWPLYGFMTFRWLLWGDFESLIRGRIGQFQLKGFNAAEFVALFAGKALFFGWALVLPLALNWSVKGAAVVLAAYIGLTLAFSFVLTTTFQLAHCVDETMFSSEEDANSEGKLPNEWAIHQVLTTSDFCPRNRVITWFMGGLNFQIEHHLFPRDSHIHYPAIAQFVRSACQSHNIPYLCQPSLLAALVSHYRHLKTMGQPPKVVTP